MKKDNNEQIDIQKLIKEKGIKSIKDLVHMDIKMVHFR